jgi:hypothetical protein
VQLVVKDHSEVVEVEHLGSAHTDAELALLLAAARERLQPVSGPSTSASWRPNRAGGRVEGTAALMLWNVLDAAYAGSGSTPSPTRCSGRWCWPG